MTSIICSFCGKVLSSKQAYNTHLKMAKYCLELRKKETNFESMSKEELIQRITILTEQLKSKEVKEKKTCTYVSSNGEKCTAHPRDNGDKCSKHKTTRKQCQYIFPNETKCQEYPRNGEYCYHHRKIAEENDYATMTVHSKLKIFVTKLGFVFNREKRLVGKLVKNHIVRLTLADLNKAKQLDYIDSSYETVDDFYDQSGIIFKRKTLEEKNYDTSDIDEDEDDAERENAITIIYNNTDLTREEASVLLEKHNDISSSIDDWENNYIKKVHILMRKNDLSYDEAQNFLDENGREINIE